jgi:SAM-dependent methyltransferase
LPFADATFDLITSALGVNNMDDPPSALAECARVAKSGARIVITSNTRGHMPEFYNAFREVLAGSDRYLERLDANVNHRASRESLSAMLEAAGFRVTQVHEEIFEWRYLDGTALLGHNLTRFGFLDGWRAVVDRDDEATVFAQLESRLNAIAHEQGELRVTIPMLYVEGQRG